MVNKSIIVLCGIPTSGKTTWRENFLKNHSYARAVSRDDIRDRLFGKDYWKKQKEKLNYAYSRTANERFVTEVFDRQVQSYLEDINVQAIVLDNTHCQESYLDRIILKYEGKVRVYINFFDISITKAYYRNIIRWLKTGKRIPVKVIKNMYDSYNDINKSRYEKYMVFI